MRLSLSPITALRSSATTARISPISIRAASTSTSLDASTIATPDVPTSPAAESVAEIRLKAIKLYKELHRLGRDYPDPNYEFNKRLRRAFEKNSKTTDPAALQKQLELGEHIKKGPRFDIPQEVQTSKKVLSCQ